MYNEENMARPAPDGAFFNEVATPEYRRVDATKSTGLLAELRKLKELENFSETLSKVIATKLGPLLLVRDIGEEKSISVDQREESRKSTLTGEVSKTTERIFKNLRLISEMIDNIDL